MRILLTAHQFLPDFSAGTEVMTLEVARELIRRGHDVQIFAGFPGEAISIPDDKRLDRYEYDGIVVHRFAHAFVAMGDQSNVIEQEHDNHLAARFFKKILDAFSPDLVHAFHLARLSASLLDVCEEHKLPVIFSAHDFWPVCPTSQLLLPGDKLCGGPVRNSANCLRHLALTPEAPLWRRMFYRLPDWAVGMMAGMIRRGIFPPTPFNPVARALIHRPKFIRERLNRTARIIVPSQFMGDMLARHGIDRAKILKIPNGIDLAHISPANRTRPAGPLRIGFIGTLGAHKGVHVLIEAIRRLGADANLTLTIHGMPGPSAAYMQRIETQMRNESRIRMAGSFEHDRIGEILRALDVVVVPSIWYENAPLVIFEARAAGCVVVASNLGGMAEAIQQGRDGLLFPAGDSAALSEILRQLIRDPALAAKIAGSSERPITLSQHVDSVVRVYDEAILLLKAKNS